MVDDHVDRPGVEAQQCVKLTGTNNSIGLIVRIAHAHLFPLTRRDSARMSWHDGMARKTASRILNMHFADLVVMAERLHPIPFRTRP